MPEKPIPEWYIDTYEQNVMHELQQKESLLSGLFEPVTIEGEKRRFQYIAKRRMKPIEGRWNDTEIEESSFSVRWAFARLYGDAFPMDETDVERAFCDPSSDMTKAGVAAANRLKDEVIIDALTATAIEGHNADQFVAFPDAQKLSVQIGSPSSTPANTGLTIAKLKRAKFMFDRAEIDPQDPRYFLCTAWQIQNLLDTTEVTSSEYNSVKALVDGTVDKFLGFKFVPIELLPWASNIRNCFACTRNSIDFGLKKGLTVKSAEVPMKNFNRLTQLKINLGAVRKYDKGVVMVPCSEPENPLA